MKWPWNKKNHGMQTKPEKRIREGDIRQRLVYTGRVQAVGFRFTVQGLAEQRGVHGWVRNLDDGDVMIEAQGTPEQIEQLKQDIIDTSESERSWIRARLIIEEPLELEPENSFSIAGSLY